MRTFIVFKYSIVSLIKLMKNTALVREVAVVLELCERYECGWVLESGKLKVVLKQLKAATTRRACSLPL